MNKQIVIINGTGGSGKDTFVEFCKKYAGVINFSSIDKVKEIARLIGWDGKKTEKDRKFLSDLKKLTTEYNDMAFKSTLDAVAEFEKSNDEIMFIHIREPEEIKRAAECLNAFTLLVKRDGLENITTNYSDASVDNYNYDYAIVNTSLNELDQKAQQFVTTLKNTKSKFYISQYAKDKTDNI